MDVIVLLSRGRKELAHMTEWEGRSEAALGRPLLSVAVTMSYTSLGRKTTGGCRQALVMEHWEACGRSVPAAGATDEGEEPEEGSWEDNGVTDTWTLFWPALGPGSGWEASPGLCLLMTDGGPRLARGLCLSPGALASSEGPQGCGDLARSPCEGAPGGAEDSPHSAEPGEGRARQSRPRKDPRRGTHHSCSCDTNYPCLTTTGHLHEQNPPLGPQKRSRLLTEPRLARTQPASPTPTPAPGARPQQLPRRNRLTSVLPKPLPCGLEPPPPRAGAPGAPLPAGPPAALASPPHQHGQLRAQSAGETRRTSSLNRTREPPTFRRIGRGGAAGTAAPHTGPSCCPSPTCTPRRPG